MKFTSVIATVLAAASCVSAASKTTTSLDVSQVIHGFYRTATPSIKNGAQSTALAKTLVHVESSWESSPQWTSVAEAIISAAPSSAQASLTNSGFDYDVLTAANWYNKVDHSARKAYSSEVAALNSAASKVLKNDARETGAAMIVAGAAAGVMGVVAAL